VFHILIWGPWGFVWRVEVHQSTPVVTGLNPPELPISDEARNDEHIASTCHIKKRNGKLMMHQKVS